MPYLLHYNNSNIEEFIVNELLVESEVGSRIITLRAKEVMLDRDLAELYQVETKVLNQAVKRNIKRFPEDFMFQMTDEEFKNWRSQFVTSNSDKMGINILNQGDKCLHLFLIF